MQNKRSEGTQRKSGRKISDCTIIVDFQTPIILSSKEERQHIGNVLASQMVSLISTFTVANEGS